VGTYLRIALMIVSVVLAALVILQAKGGNLGGMFGGDGGIYQTRRGVEKTVFNMTVLFSVIFLALAIFGVGR
jgi:preprotein translocase subunit SecG